MSLIGCHNQVVAWYLTYVMYLVVRVLLVGVTYILTCHMSIVTYGRCQIICATPWRHHLGVIALILSELMS